jgi:dephospho-CoA kinase
MIHDKTKIVGIGGQGRTGKDTFAELFLKRNYFGFSFGDKTREIARVRHASDPDPVSRANTTETSNWFREKYGPDYLLNLALKEFDEASADKHYEGLLLWSIRAPIEADFIRDHGGVLIYLDSSEETRYKRYMEALRTGEPELSFDGFMKQENLQIKPQPGIPAEIQMDHGYIKDKASIIFVNDYDSIEVFLDNANKLIDSIET